MAKKNIVDKEYVSFVQGLKKHIQNVQIKAHVLVNTELIMLYWDMGKDIVEKQKSTSWGDRFLERLSIDLQKEFPGMKGFSFRNLKYIRQWYEYWSAIPIGQQLVAQLENPEFWQQAVAKEDIEAELEEIR